MAQHLVAVLKTMYATAHRPAAFWQKQKQQLDDWLLDSSASATDREPVKSFLDHVANQGALLAGVQQPQQHTPVVAHVQPPQQVNIHDAVQQAFNRLLAAQRGGVREKAPKQQPAAYKAKLAAAAGKLNRPPRFPPGCLHCGGDHLLVDCPKPMSNSERERLRATGVKMPPAQQ